MPSVNTVKAKLAGIEEVLRWVGYWADETTAGLIHRDTPLTAYELVFDAPSKIEDLEFAMLKRHSGEELARRGGVASASIMGESPWRDYLKAGTIKFRVEVDLDYIRAMKKPRST